MLGKALHSKAFQFNLWFISVRQFEHNFWSQWGILCSKMYLGVSIEWGYYGIKTKTRNTKRRVMCRVSLEQLGPSIKSRSLLFWRCSLTYPGITVRKNFLTNSHKLPLFGPKKGIENFFSLQFWLTITCSSCRKTVKRIPHLYRVTGSNPTGS